MAHSVADRPPADVPRGLVDGSVDVLVAVLLDAAGGPLATSERDAERGPKLAELVWKLVECADSTAGDPVEQIEVQVPGGSVYAVRSTRHVLACVTRRGAQRALVLYELRRTLLALEGAG